MTSSSARRRNPRDALPRPSSTSQPCSERAPSVRRIDYRFGEPTAAQSIRPEAPRRGRTRPRREIAIGLPGGRSATMAGGMHGPSPPLKRGSHSRTCATPSNQSRRACWSQIHSTVLRDSRPGILSTVSRESSGADWLSRTAGIGSGSDMRTPYRTGSSDRHRADRAGPRRMSIELAPPVRLPQSAVLSPNTLRS